MTVVWSVKILVDKKDLSTGDIGATLSIPGIFVIPNDQVRSNPIYSVHNYLKVTWVMKSLFCFGPGHLFPTLYSIRWHFTSKV